MNRPNAITCPGCGAAIPRPKSYDDEGGWLALDAWCDSDGCGGTASRLEAPLVYGPRWYAMVSAAFDRLSPMMGLVLEPDSIEGMWNQAFIGAESTVMEPMSDTVEAIEIDAAERTALAIGILAYGVEFADLGKPDVERHMKSPEGEAGVTLDDIREAHAIVRPSDYDEDDVIRIAESAQRRRMATEFFDRIRAGDHDAIDEAIYLIQVHALPDDHPMSIDG